jgi:hypothetical protein
MTGAWLSADVSNIGYKSAFVTIHKNNYGETFMDIAHIQKLGGISLILGSVLLLIYSVLCPVLLPIDAMVTNFASVVLNPHWIWLCTAAFFGVIFLMFGFMATYSRMYSTSGVVGLLGFIMIEIAYILQACSITWEIFVWPLLASYQQSQFIFHDGVFEKDTLVMIFGWIATISIFVGVILFCIAIIRSKVFPKISGALIFVGAVLYGVGSFVIVIGAMIGVFILSIGCTIIGLKLIKQDAE